MMHRWSEVDAPDTEFPMLFYSIPGILAAACGPAQPKRVRLFSGLVGLVMDVLGSTLCTRRGFNAAALHKRHQNAATVCSTTHTDTSFSFDPQRAGTVFNTLPETCAS